MLVQDIWNAHPFCKFDDIIFVFWQTLLEERRELQQSNYLLQHKLAEHFRKKKADDARQDYDKTANDQDSKYVKYMGR